MGKRDIGNEILEGLREIRAHKAGARNLVIRNIRDVSSPGEIRHRLQLSQAAFAGLMGVSVRTVQDWEQGRRSPSGSARVLLRIADEHPEIFTTVQ